MKPQPSYAQAGSVYYICLLRDELLLHQGRQNKNKKVTQAKGFIQPLLLATKTCRKFLLIPWIFTDSYDFCLNKLSTSLLIKGWWFWIYTVTLSALCVTAQRCQTQCKAVLISTFFCRWLCVSDERQQTHTWRPASAAVLSPPVSRQSGQTGHLPHREALEERKVRW